MRKERERKFHERVLNILYPPPSPPQEDLKEEEPSLYGCVDLEDKISSSSRSSASEEDNKLTRAQRKNIRKKKLKEAAEKRRRRGIGPLLPSSHSIGNEKNDSDSQTNPTAGGGDDDSNALNDCQRAANDKLKNRRMAKKLNRRSREMHSEVDATHQIHPSSSIGTSMPQKEAPSIRGSYEEA